MQSNSSNMIDSEDYLQCTIPQKMRRVDWRWAAAKGFLNKETNKWNEEMGGQEAYLKQRNDRMMARSVPPTCQSQSIHKKAVTKLLFELRPTPGIGVS
jgi:hypothetical protein